MRTAAATRFFGSSPERDLPRIDSWVEGALRSADRVLVAVDVRSDRTGAVDHLRTSHPEVEVLPMHQWGFVVPLNALALAAAASGCDRILFSSAEFVPSAEGIEELSAEHDDTTLVVGARLPGHDFRADAGPVEADGLQVPWNTYALYDLRRLCRLGFPLIGDSPFDPRNAGVEELTCFLVHQRIDPSTTIRLVQVPAVPFAWNMDGWDQERMARHDLKMRTKISRPEAQLVELGSVLGPTVTHLVSTLTEQPSIKVA